MKQMWRRVGALLVVVALVACSGSAAAAKPFVALREPLRVRASGLLLLNPGVAGLPMICTGAVALSLPPLCGGPKVRGVDIESLARVEHARGISWVGGTVEGVLRNGVITVTRPVDQRPRRSKPYRFPRCVPTRPGPYQHPTQSEFQAVGRFVRTRYPREFDQRWSSAGGQPMPWGFVASSATIERIRHRLDAEFPRVSLCVASLRHHRQAYERQRKRLEAATDELRSKGVMLTSVGSPIDAVDATVEIADPVTLRYLRHRFPLVTFTSQIEVLGPA